MDSSVEEHNTNQLSAECLKDTNDQKKQEKYHLTAQTKLIKSSVTDLKVEANTMSSDNNIYVSKVQNLQVEINTIKSDPITIIKKEESKEKTQKIKSVISGNSKIIDNKSPDNV